MKMYAEASAFDDEKLVDDIEESATTATRYIYELNQDGIFVHQDDTGKDGKNPTDATAYGVHISDDVDIIRAGQVVASYGEAATIGKADKSHAYLDYHSFQMFYGNETDPYVHFSDLRDESGYATLTDTFIGDGSNAAFSVNHTVYSVTTVTVDGTATTAYSRSGKTFTLTTVPSAGAVVAITYVTNDEVKAFTLGDRNSPDGTAIGNRSLAVGTANYASGEKSFAHGTDNKATGTHSFASGYMCEASGGYSHAEGSQSTASGHFSHAEGALTTASGRFSHAEGSFSEANGDGSHAEGYSTTASGKYSHTEGSATTASGKYSHAQNLATIAASEAQTAIGKHNIEDAADKYVFLIGNGSSAARSNAFTVDWNGLIDSASFGSVPYIAYTDLGYSSAPGLQVFLTAYFQRVMQNVLEASPNYEHKAWIGVAAPDSTGLIIFNVYGPVNSSHMPQYGTGFITRLGGSGSAGGIAKFSINNYTLTTASL